MTARTVAVAYVVLVVAGGAAVIAGLGGLGPTAVLIAGGAMALLVCAVVAAGSATHAFLRRRWGWGAILVLAWPISVPAYLWRLGRSVEPDVG